MNSLIIAGLLIVLLGVAYQMGWSKSRALVTTSGVKVHSRAQYHGSLVAIWTIIPALLVVGLWAYFSDAVTHSYIVSQLPADVVAGLDATGWNTLTQRIQAIASGYGVAGEVQPYEQSAGDALRQFQFITFLVVIAAAAGTGILALLYARSRITARLRARNTVESIIKLLLLLCSAIAILTTVGIVASLVTEAFKFFTFISPLDFFFGTVWAPKFSTTASGDAGQYGILPLLSGTLMVSIIAMLVAVPVGLMTAV
ncbi:MAG TPA: phosphate ABC transporter permease family protein, partial [Devosia sp.]|nr:phosphate ABC transporter permease family protein [Devosia sp.]